MDPGPLSMTSKRFSRISQDPYVRSSYFLARYGPQQAFYWTLFRGRLVDERVLDVRLLIVLYTCDYSNLFLGPPQFRSSSFALPPSSCNPSLLPHYRTLH